MIYVAESPNVPTKAIIGEGMWTDSPPNWIGAVWVHRLIQYLNGLFISYRFQEYAQKFRIDTAMQYRQ